MKGVVFNLLEEFVTENWGDDTYEKILDACPAHVSEPRVGPETYEDADFMAMVGKTIEILGVSAEDGVRAFGKFCFPKLAAKVPQFVDQHDHPKEFLKTIDSVIHVEVKKLLKDADTPKFRFTDDAPDTLELEYVSKRRLCMFVEGLLEGVAEYFKTPIDYRQTECTASGADACRFALTFASVAETVS